MLKLISVELKKIQHFRAAWIIIGLYLVLLPLFFNIFNASSTNGISLDKAAIYSFPEIWSYLTYVASYFHMLPGFLIIMLVGNEYNYRTFRQHIIEGYSHLDLLTGKLLLIGLIALVLAVYVFILGISFGFLNTPEVSTASIVQKIHFVPIYALQTVAYLILALFISAWVKRTALSIIFYLSYIWIIEKLIGLKLPDEISQYFPASAFSDLIPFPMRNLLMMAGIPVKDLSLTIAIAVTITYSFVFSGLSYLLLKKRDL